MSNDSIFACRKFEYTVGAITWEAAHYQSKIVSDKEIVRLCHVYDFYLTLCPIIKHIPPFVFKDTNVTWLIYEWIF